MQSAKIIDTSACIFMAALHSRCGHYISVRWFLIFSLPNLSRRRLDVYHTSTRCGLSANL